MEPVRCPNCDRSFILMGVDDYRETIELVLFCVHCCVMLQLEVQRKHDEDQDGYGQYL